MNNYITAKEVAMAEDKLRGQYEVVLVQWLSEGGGFYWLVKNAYAVIAKTKGIS